MEANVQIEYRGIYLDINGKYNPAEPRTYEYPGYPAEFEIYRVFIAGGEIDILALVEDDIEEIERLALESYEES